MSCMWAGLHAHHVKGVCGCVEQPTHTGVAGVWVCGCAAVGVWGVYAALLQQPPSMPGSDVVPHEERTTGAGSRQGIPRAGQQRGSKRVQTLATPWGPDQAGPGNSCSWVCTSVFCWARGGGTSGLPAHANCTAVAGVAGGGGDATVWVICL
jgi:hypothetical protein